MVTGYGIWIFCHIIHQSSRQYFAVTFITLALEISILSFAPWFIWLMDAPFKAGETFLSQYSLVIMIRWLVVLIFQLPLLTSIIQFFAGLVFQLMEMLKNWSRPSSDPSINQNDDSSSNNFEKKTVGRPKKAN